MEWFLAALVLPVLAVAALAGSGRLGGMPPVVHDAPVVSLPEGDLTASDVRGLTFEVTTRGYSIAQVDEVLDRLAAQLDRRPVGRSAILDADEFSQSGREGEHGSNEAPHG